MAKRIDLTLYIVIFLFTQNVFAQDPTSRIEKLRLGSITGSFSFSGASLSGETWGRFSNGNYYPWFSIFENPAFFSGIRSPRILFQFDPGQKYSITNLAHISSTVNEEIDNNIQKYRADDLQVGYPAMKVEFDRKINWPEGMFLFPVEKFTLGLYFFRAMQMSLDFDVIGVESSISTVMNTGGGTNRVVLNNYIDAVNRIHFGSTNAGIFITRVLSHRFIASLMLERQYYNFNINSDLNIQGSMYFNGKEYLFNDPGTLWPTNISQILHAGYAGSAWRINWAGIYIFRRNLIFDGVLGFVSSSNLSGSLTGERNKIPALNFDALKGGGGVDEILDAAKLDPSKLTYTENVGWENHPELQYYVPNQLKIGILYRLAKWSFYLSNRFYLGSYNLGYGKDFVELKPKIFSKLYISRGGFFTKLGVFAFSYYAPESQDFSSDTSTIPSPFLTLGYGREMMKRLALIGNLDILPIPWVSFGVQYKF
ncbi:MAG TPA: hypothetical protein ENH29_07440 [Bacteroidetes bacterium]|nr:hypothetical protein [Bacteroidota bacterium]